MTTQISQATTEAVLIELYRQQKLTHHQLAAALNLSRIQTDALLKAHGISYDITAEEITRESASLRPSHT